MNQIKVLAYARVSTTDQAEKALSIPAQLKAIKEYADKNQMVIVEEYIDEGKSAYRDVDRINFDAMIRHALDIKEIKHILVHEISRFSRNRYKISAIKGKLLEHGKSLISVTSPVDPNSPQDLFKELIDEGLAQSYSMQIAQHTHKGMKENASQRDPETGYTYKNGGYPPYGYKVIHKFLGNDMKKENVKSLWEIDPDTAPIVRKIVVDWTIGEGLSRHKIRDRLNEQKIPGPTGKLWGSSTIGDFLRLDRLEQYAGIYHWNKSVNWRNKGKRFKNKEEWVSVPNAHPAIITIEEVEAARKVAESKRPKTPGARSSGSNWYLTGLNWVNESFFTCKTCGSNMVGIKTSGGGRYYCGKNRQQGKVGCSNNNSVNKIKIENNILNQIEEVFSNATQIETLADKFNSKLNESVRSYNKDKKILEKKIEKVEAGINKVFEGFEKGLDADLCRERLERHKQEKTEIQKELKILIDNKPKPISISPQIITNTLKNLRQVFESGTNEQKKNLFRTYIKTMEFDPEQNKIKVVFWAHDTSNYKKKTLDRNIISERYGNP